MRFCIVCKKTIDPERADAFPETRLCTEHGRRIAEYGGEFIVSASHDRTSKPGSLKHNYGGISTKQTRNHEAIERLRDEYEREQFENA